MLCNSDDSDFEWHIRVPSFPSDNSESEIPAKRAAKDVNIGVEDSNADRTIFKVNKHKNEGKPHKSHILKKKHEDKKDAKLHSTYPVNSYPNNWKTIVKPPSNLNKTYPPLGSSRDCNTNRFRNQKRTRWSCNDSSSTRSMNSSSIMLPCYKNYQLLGDSQLVRFSEQLLNAKKYVTYTKDRCRSIGYCISGQKIEQLKQRLSRKDFPLSDKVIMLIGTNDFVYNTKLESMYESYEAILKIFTESSVSKIILLTVPPVPKINQEPGYLNKFKEFNRFIRRHNKEGRIVIDVASLFVDFDSNINLHYFEETFRSNKEDRVHLNRDGLKLVQSVIDINYFDKQI